MSPFPFDGAEQQFSLVRRLVPKREWPDGDAFRHELFATEPERATITVRAAWVAGGGVVDRAGIR